MVRKQPGQRRPAPQTTRASNKGVLDRLPGFTTRVRDVARSRSGPRSVTREVRIGPLEDLPITQARQALQIARPALRQAAWAATIRPEGLDIHR